jgi:methylglutaconyl-CoA hydratase
VFFQLHVPTVAVVQGPAVAGGLGLVLACDLVLASDAASFALPEPKRGITAAVITPLLVYRAGVSGASYLLLSGESIDARCAHAMGFVHAVEPADRLTTAAEALVQSILAGAPGALAITKQQLMTCGGQNILAQLETAAAVSARARETLEAREGLQAFLEKREPNWIVPGERGASAP